MQAGARSAYSFISLLISCAVTVLIIGIIARSTNWAMGLMRATRFRGKRLVAAQSAFDLLMKDCIGASENSRMWIKTSSGWVYYTGGQWVLWHKKKSKIYRKYGLFNPNDETWINAQSENVAPVGSDVFLEPRFAENHLSSVNITLTIPDTYGKTLSFSATVQ